MYPLLKSLINVSTNFLKVIGDHIDGNGLAEVWVGSGLLGPGPTELVFQGKAYNNGLTAHKLTV